MHCNNYPFTFFINESIIQLQPIFCTVSFQFWVNCLWDLFVSFVLIHRFLWAQFVYLSLYSLAPNGRKMQLLVLSPSFHPDKNMLLKNYNYCDMQSASFAINNLQLFLSVSSTNYNIKICDLWLPCTVICELSLSWYCMSMTCDMWL